MHGKSYITFNGITTQGGNGNIYPTDGTTFDIVDSSNITVENCISQYSWLDAISVLAQTQNISNITLLNNQLYHSGNGLEIAGESAYGVTNLTCDGLTSAYIGQFVNDARGTGALDREGLGINGNSASSNFTLSNLLIHDVGDSITANNMGVFLYQINSVTMSKYFIYNCARLGVEIQDGTEANGNNITLSYGIVMNNGATTTADTGFSGGIALVNANGSGMNNIDIYNTDVYGNSGAASSNSNKQGGLVIYKEFTAANAAPITIKNNIICENITNDLQIYENTGVLSGLTLDYNDYYRTSGTSIIYDGTSYDYQHITGASSGYYTYDTSKGAHSISSNPLFTNGSGSYSLATDFELQSTSPAIGAGTNVGLTTDYAGNPVPSVPDIGAYEFVAPILPPSGLRLTQ